MWDREYPQARVEPHRVLDAKPSSKDARLAMIDLELWSNNYEAALLHSTQGLRFYPKEEEFLIRDARILNRLDKLELAAQSLDRLLLINPSHDEGRRLYDRIQTSTQLFKLFQKYRYDRFERDRGSIRNWHLGTFGLSVKLKAITFIGRVNYASRTFGSKAKTGYQYEMDIYPKFVRGLYAYLNAGYSNSSIFPKYRYGAELYASLPQSFEISAGFRYLQFSSSDVLIYTGSLGKYIKNNWISFRPYITSKPSGLSFSGNLIFRHYLSDSDNYLGLLFGFGSSPVDIFFLEDIERLNSYKIGLEINRKLSKALILRVSFRFEREELNVGIFGNRYVFAIRLEELIFRKY